MGCLHVVELNLKNRCCSSKASEEYLKFNKEDVFSSILKTILRFKFSEEYLQIIQGVINDPLGRTHSPASSNHYFHLKIVFFLNLEKLGRTYRQTTCVEIKIVITAGRDCGLVSWINTVYLPVLSLPS